MKKFVVLYYQPPEGMAKMASSTPEEMKQGMADWMQWFDKNGDGIVDQGEYFGQGTRFVGTNSEDSSGKVTGYSIIQAESYESAQDMVKDHPHLSWFDGCAVEVYEPMQMQVKD